jgi:hypothetical protein
MRAITGVSALPGVMNGHRSVTLCRKSFEAPTRRAGKTGHGLTVSRIDRLISGAGAVALALSAFYFAPIVGSIFLK